MLLLTWLEKQDKPVHGYAYAKSMKNDSERVMAYSTAYRALKRLVQMGYASAEWHVENSGGPPRQVFSITHQGEQHLAGDAAA